MGDYSRDTFRLTNILHQVATGNAVSDARHYIGVRQQQGVPLLDADWNELEDIRRLEHEVQLRHYFGDGIPFGDQGFRISAVSDPNDFAIGNGMALASGRMAFNAAANLTYGGQAALFGVSLPALAPPPTPEREDLVYLDIWEEEIGATGISQVDERLTNPAIGVETCRRLQRRWLVRVLPGESALSAVPTEPGHVYLALARVRRVSGQDQILDSRIFDLRRTDLNVARYLKVPIRVERGLQLLDSARFADLLQALREVFLLRLAQSRFFLDAGHALGQMLIQIAAQHVIQVCSSGALSARTFNLTNADAAVVLLELAAAQREFTSAVQSHGIASLARDAFVSGYRARLDALEAAAAADLLEGSLQQQALNAWLAADVNGLPEGTVAVQFVELDPDEPLQATATYDVYVRLDSGVTASSQAQEIFDVSAALSSAPWSIQPSSAAVTITNGTSEVLVFQLTVPGPVVGGSEAELSVVARARRNPALVSTQPPLLLRVGERPLTGGVLQYAGPALNAEGRLELPNAPLTSDGLSFSCNVNNRDATAHAYGLQWSLALAGGAAETGWFPLPAAAQGATISVAAESSDVVQITLSGPNAADVTGTQGTLTISVASIDAAPQADPERLIIDFVVV